MTWTYNPTSLSTSALFRVRFLCGDTDTTDQQVQDEEITFALAKENNVEDLAAALVCEHLAAKFSREASKTIGSLSVSAGERAKAYAERASALRVGLQTGGAVPSTTFCGGLSISGKQTLDQDADAVQPNFTVGLDDNPRAPFQRSTPYNEEEV